MKQRNLKQNKIIYLSIEGTHKFIWARYYTYLQSGKISKISCGERYERLGMSQIRTKTLSRL